MDTGSSRQLSGQIKWFDPSKGFGFVVADEGGPDILLHANVLRNFGQGSVADGSIVEIEVQETERGLQATAIISITPPTDGLGPSLGDMEEITLEEIAQHSVTPTRVKWFDKGKGFGFANRFGDSTDVFVHIEVLRRSGLSDLATGEAVGMRIMEGKRGLMAIEITSWETTSK